MFDFLKKKKHDAEDIQAVEDNRDLETVDEAEVAAETEPAGVTEATAEQQEAGAKSAQATLSWDDIRQTGNIELEEIDLDDIPDEGDALDEEDFEEAEVDEDAFEEAALDTPADRTSEFYLEEADDDDDEEKRSIGKTILKVLLGIIGFAAVAYLAVSAFFIGHFYYDTTINGHDFSLKSAADVEKYMSQQVDDYKLTLNELGGVTEDIVGADIGIQYKQSTQIKKQLKAQNPLLWVTAFWKPDDLNVDVGVDYDEAKLADIITKLQCMDESKWTKSTSAKPEFDGNEFVVAKEIYGTTLNKDAFNQAVRDAISQFMPELNLEESGCYQAPKFTSTSPEVQKACDSMNNYSKASVTYTFGDNKEVVDRNIIKDWLTVDMNTMAVTYNEKKVTEYMKALGKKYDTIGKQRTITSPVGETVKVSGGIYGWELDEEKEGKALKEHIKKGETITKEPAWVQKAASFGDVDWGSTYAECDISRQHMWYIRDGKVVFECDVVTGLPTAKRATPTGVNPCLEKAQNKTLRGDRLPNGKYEYETPVAYWMRVTWTGVGFHTATWQPWFGGNRYQYAGSHGCINMSYSNSQTLYGLLQMGEPIIIHE